MGYEGYNKECSIGICVGGAGLFMEIDVGRGKSSNLSMFFNKLALCFLE